VNYTVVWAIDAERELAAIWTSSADRSIIAEAADSLDKQLSRNPTDVGESRPNVQRIAYSLPLGVRFEVLDADRLVRVLAVWLCRHGDK
jgi:hypothetical protein